MLRALSLATLALALSACASSHMITGQPRPPTDPAQVRVYFTPPPSRYEEIAVLDTNCDPDEADFPIPGNDDAIRSAELLTKVIAAAVADGLIARSGRGRGGNADEKPEAGTVAAGEPLPEWERDLYEGAEARFSVTASCLPGRGWPRRCRR